MLYVICATTVVLSALWSWLFSVRVAALSTSLLVGYTCTLFAFAVIVGLSTTLFVLTVRYFMREYHRQTRLSPWFLAKLFVVWAAVELGVSVLITIVWLGRNGSIDSVLPFGSFAPLLAFTPLVFVTRFVGFHGLSATAVVLVSVLVCKKLRRYAPAVVCVVLAGVLLGWGVYRLPVGQALRVHILASHEDVPGPVATTSQLVVFPEYGMDGIARGESIYKPITNSDHEVFYIGSRHQPVLQGDQNVLVFGSTTQGILAQQAKTRLIPGGEYLPYVVELPLRLLGAHKTLQQFNQVRAVEKGPKKITPLTVMPDIRLGSGICASIIAPKDYRGLTKDGATVLTNSASLGILKSPLFTFEHLGLARFMAVANARPFLQSSSDGLAFVIDHNGQILAKTTAVDSREVTIRSSSRKTPYTYLGEWPAYVGLLWLVWVGVRGRWTSRRTSKKHLAF